MSDSSLSSVEKRESFRLSFRIATTPQRIPQPRFLTPLLFGDADCWQRKFFGDIGAHNRMIRAAIHRYKRPGTVNTVVQSLKREFGPGDSPGVEQHCS
jgi:hypothetical protein